MSYQFNQRNQQSLAHLWQDFRARAMSKQANGVSPYTDVAMAPDRGEGARTRAVHLALASLLGGAAIGGTVTGISGLHKLINQPEPPTIPNELEMEVPVPEKRATEGVAVGGPEWWGSQHAQSPADVWWTIPTAAAGFGGGMLGMSSLMEHLIKRKRKGMQDKRLQDAQGNLEQSMLSQYKQSSADSLDTLFDRVEKRGALGWDTADSGKEWAPLGVGATITAGGLLAALAARGGYKSQEGGTNEDLLNKALKNRAYLESLRSPVPVTLTPKPTPTEEPQQ